MPKDLEKFLKIFEKKAEQIDRDSFQNVITKASFEIQKVLSENSEYYKREYFGGKDFAAAVTDGDPETSTVYISVTPDIQPTSGITQGTNQLYFENELTDKVTPFGLVVKVR